MKKIIQWIKNKLNVMHYNSCMNGIMSDAIEYDIEPHIVESWLQANYENHFPEEAKKAGEQDG